MAKLKAAAGVTADYFEIDSDFGHSASGLDAAKWALRASRPSWPAWRSGAKALSSAGGAPLQWRDPRGSAWAGRMTRH